MSALTTAEQARARHDVPATVAAVLHAKRPATRDDAIIELLRCGFRGGEIVQAMGGSSCAS